MKRISQELQELAMSYLTEIARELRDLTEQSKPLDPGTDTKKWLMRMQRTSHKLKGSGGSYGFPTISALASKLEKICDRLLTHDPHSLGRAKIEPAVANLAELADEIDLQQSYLDLSKTASVESGWKRKSVRPGKAALSTYPHRCDR